jgi:hypothetical protein
MQLARLVSDCHAPSASGSKRTLAVIPSFQIPPGGLTASCVAIVVLTSPFHPCFGVPLPFLTLMERITGASQV